MNRVLEQGVLLAQQTRLDSLSRGLKGRPLQTGDVVVIGLVVAAILVVAFLISYVMKLHEQRRSYSSRRWLFLSLCRAHKLPLFEWWLLWRVSRARMLSDPASLFLQPQHLELGGLPKPLRARARALKRLRRKLFAESQGRADRGDGQTFAAGGTNRAGTPLTPAAATPTLDIAPWPPAAGPSSDLPMADQ